MAAKMNTTKKVSLPSAYYCGYAFACKRYCYEEKCVHLLFQSFCFPWNGLVCSIALNGTDTKTNKRSSTRFFLSLRCIKSGTLFTYSLFIAYGYSLFFFSDLFNSTFLAYFFKAQTSFCLLFLFASLSLQDKLNSIAAFFSFNFYWKNIGNFSIRVCHSPWINYFEYSNTSKQNGTFVSIMNQSCRHLVLKDSMKLVISSGME